MKDEIGYRHILCLINAMSGFVSVSGAGIISKYVCPGDSVEAFQNITFNNCSSVISLYINGERNTLIARWSFANWNRNETPALDYKDRVFLYGNGTISIHNVHPGDQATYIVNCQMGNMSMEDVVHIQVMAAPAKDCMPNILHLRSRLFASLKTPFCGKPVATLYWKGYGDVPNTREPVLKLNPGNQDRTYYACIEGPALTCVRNALDYCSAITTGDKSPPILSETWDVKMAIFIVVGIVLGISLTLATAVILIRKRCRKKTPSKMAAVNRRAHGNSSVTFGERTGGGEVKTTNSEPGASRVNIGSKNPSDDFHDEYCIPLQQMDQHRPTNYELTEHLVHIWLDSHPEFVKQYNGNDDQKANRKSKKSTARKLESLDSDSNDEQDALLRDPVDQNGVPQPVQVTSHRDSPDSTSYMLMWDKPDDGGSPLIKYIIRYCEVEIIPDRTEYELSKYLKPFESVDNILPSVVSYVLSPLTPGRYYLVEIQAINTQGQTLKSFIFKTKEGVPRPVEITSHRDSPDSTSYKLMWDKPEDGGSPLIKYIIRYCEVEINPNGTEYKLSKPLSQLVTVEILPSDVSYILSLLKPGSFYQVEVQAVNSIGTSEVRFIFKTNESAPEQAFEEVVPDFQLPAQCDTCPTSPIVTVETSPKFRRLSKKIMSLPAKKFGTVDTESIERLQPRNSDTVFTDIQSSSSNDEQTSDQKIEEYSKPSLGLIATTT